MTLLVSILPSFPIETVIDMTNQILKSLKRYEGYANITEARFSILSNLGTGAILRGPEVLSFGTGGRDVEGPHILHQKYIKVLDLEVQETIPSISDLPNQLTLRNTKETKEFSLVSSQSTISFTTRAQHFSNEALAALNTGDMQGLYVLGKARLTVTRVEREALKESA